MLRAYLDSDQPPHARGRDWEQISAADLRGYLGSKKPSPHRTTSSFTPFDFKLSEHPDYRLSLKNCTLRRRASLRLLLRL